jgi:hypothetical protein
MLILEAAPSQGFGQSEDAILTSGDPHSSTLANLVASFNSIRRHASDLRNAMKPGDVAVFDAATWDVMDALLALPGITVRNRTTR